jgi:hypothetical protein
MEAAIAAEANGRLKAKPARVGLRRRSDLDDPESERDFWNFVQRFGIRQVRIASGRLFNFSRTCSESIAASDAGFVFTPA